MYELHLLNGMSRILVPPNLDEKLKKQENIFKRFSKLTEVITKTEQNQRAKYRLEFLLIEDEILVFLSHQGRLLK